MNNPTRNPCNKIPVYASPLNELLDYPLSIIKICKAALPCSLASGPGKNTNLPAVIVQGKQR
jgi:hypothetical protein